ncbi:U11/U12 small nuclear ribonucleoprotein 48 kDa protein-like [Malus domestica]|uniref:U11/U12 small nuclear ribonucleoprotein 48 kDa protein-like n=1 Tax=Malus domestica TaxID=3750 RepID=UPI0039749A35
MEEIEKGGGIDCFEKGTEGKGSIPFEQPSARDITMDAEKATKTSYESAGGTPYHSRKQSHSSDAILSATAMNTYSEDCEKPKRSLEGRHEYLEDQRSVSRDMHDTGNHSRSPESHRDHGWSDRHTRNRRERDDLEVTKTKHHETKMSSSSISKYKDNRSSSQSNSHQKSKVRRDRYTYENHSSNSMEQNTFDDRYDPLEPRDVYEDNLSTNRKYARASKHSEKRENS